MRAYIQGIGAFGPGFANWQDLASILLGGQINADAPISPKPKVIPANERRRAPLAVRIAVETCSEAIAMSSLTPEETACVFTSGHGDTELTDYMCRQLASDNKQLSPTKFHNSVHNAAAGYWTIATNCQQPANSIAGLNNSVAMTLLEAMSQCVCHQQPVLLAFYDTPTVHALSSLLPNHYSFGLAMVLTPNDESGCATRLNCSVVASEASWPKPKLADSLAPLVQENPAAKSLLLAQAILQRYASTLKLPLGSASALQIDITPESALLAGS